MNSKDWLLLVVASWEGKPVSPVQLQKTLFLLGQALTPCALQTGRFYEFQPYDYGPFCATIYSHAEDLEAEGCLVISGLPNESYKQYHATPNGEQRARELRAALAPEAEEYLDRLVAWVAAQSFNSLLRSIYKAYPAMAIKSVFRE